MPKKDSFEFDAAGWLFWTICFALLVGPCIYGSFQIVYETASRFIPVAMGIVGGAIGAGIVSWAVNAVIQRYRQKRRKTQRKTQRKKTKRRK